MREALAGADHDFVLAEPAARSRRSGDKISGAKRRGPSRPKWRTRRILAMLAGGLCVAAIGGILVNALLWQKTRHPAPLFAHARPASGVKAPSSGESGPHASPRQPPRAAASAPANDKLIEKPSAESAPVEKPAGARPRQAPPAAAGEPPDARQRDPITQILKAPDREPQPAAPAPAPNKSVSAAQRALIKLGFVLKPDGVAGTSTRKAVERFERDHGLPAHGELTPALLRRLSAESGIPIN